MCNVVYILRNFKKEKHWRDDPSCFPMRLPYIISYLLLSLLQLQAMDVYVRHSQGRVRVDYLAARLMSRLSKQASALGKYNEMDANDTTPAPQGQ